MLEGGSKGDGEEGDKGAVIAPFKTTRQLHIWSTRHLEQSPLTAGRYNVGSSSVATGSYITRGLTWPVTETGPPLSS